MRYYFVIIVCIATTFYVWFQFDNFSNNKSIDELASELQEIEPRLNDLSAFETDESSNSKIVDFSKTNTTPGLKYILIWTQPNHDPLMYLLKGQEAFINRNCRVKNCFITTGVNMKDITEFDVVLFNGPEVVDKRNPMLPSKRSRRQKYVFASIESSDYYPICDKRYNGYFNISWTYKLNSDIFYGYIIIRNSKGEIIGPKKEMHWMNIDEMKPINKPIKRKLSSKNKLAAWMVSNCNAPSGRDTFVKRVQQQLKVLDTDMMVDVYGDCGTMRCPRNKMPYCLQNFERNYYFYFSFENSFSEDYVTEKVLHALQHYSIPVVYGTANYSRFMPEGSYLNAKELGAEQLAKTMLEIASDKNKYYSFFKWLNHYSFHYVEESPETDFICNFCEAMNDEDLMSRVTVIDNFYEWWNPAVIRRYACPARL